MPRRARFLDDENIDPLLRGSPDRSDLLAPSDSASSPASRANSDLDLSDLDVLDSNEFPSEDEAPAKRYITPSTRGRARTRARAHKHHAAVAAAPYARPRKYRKDSKNYKTPEAQAEFRRVNGLVTAAWVREDYDTALACARDAVQLDPSQFSLHATIAEILQLRGQSKDAADALFIGVQSTQEVQNWWYVVDFLNKITVEPEETRKKLIYCYANIMKKDGTDFQARVGRMRCYQLLGNYKRARADCLAALKLQPSNLELLKLVAELSDKIEDPAGAVEPFAEFMKIRMRSRFTDDPALDWEVASSYVELLAQAGQVDTAITILRQICRWLLGRRDESFWDDWEDDREWDIDDDRRDEVEQFVADDYDEDSYGLGLPIEFRVRLATLRVRQNPDDISEAMRHLNLLEPEECDDEYKLEGLVDLFLEAAETLRQGGHHKEALRFYEPLRNVTETMDAEFFFELAICYQALDRAEDVKSAIEGIKQGDRSAGAQIGLAKLYQSQGKLDLMWRVCSQLRRIGKSDLLRQAGLPTSRPAELPADPSRAMSGKTDGTRAHKRNKLVRAEEEKQERLRDHVIRAMWDDIRPLEHPLFEDDEERGQQWLSVANELYHEFRSQPAFFPRDKATPFNGYGRYKFSETFDPAASARQNKLEYKVPTMFRDISFDDWLDFLMYYAIRLASKGNAEKCDAVLKDTETANVNYCEPARTHIVRNTALRCAILLNQEDRACREARWFHRTYALAADSTALASAANRALHQLPSVFHDGPEQKYSLRQVKTMDWGVMTVRGDTAARDALFPTGGPQSHIKYAHAVHDPCLFAQYGHSMLLGAAPASGISYYFRALAVAPGDALLHLHLGIAYVALALKRQSANRQYHIQQGLCFVHEYHRMRMEDSSGGAFGAVRRQEAEFNLGMVYHSLALFQHALPAFERVLGMSAEVQREGRALAASRGSSSADVVIEDFAPEAALAIRSILALNGDVAAAQAVTAKWLVL